MCNAITKQTKVNEDIVNPLISIIVPIYKVELYIKKCIESILNQNYRNIEIILVDDGSPDNCGAICDEYAEKDDRITVLHKENGGQSSARNAGLDIASGDYIGFVDSDDWIEPEMFESLINLAELKGADIVQCGFRSVLDDESINRVYNDEDADFNNNEKVLSAYFNQKKINDVLWNKLYKRNLFDDLRMIEGRLYEDTIIISELLLRTNIFVNIKNTYYNYLRRESSTIGAPFSPKKLDAIFAGEYVLELCEKKAPKYVGNAHLQLCLNCFYIYNDLKIHKNDKWVSIENEIINKFKYHYKITKNNNYFPLTDNQSKLLIKSFAFSKILAITLYRFYRRLRPI